MGLLYGRISEMKKQKLASKISIYILLLLGSAMCLIPLIWMVRSSLMTSAQIFEMPPKWIPNPFQWENYTEAFSALPFDKYFLNTLIYVVLGVMGTVLSCSISAYGLTRIKWKLRNAVFSIIISSMMLPFAVTLIPLYVMWCKIGITNSLLPLIIPCWFGGAFYIFLLRQFFLSIPFDLDESARIDGAGHLRICMSIIIPISRPVLVVVALFAFLNTWNDFLGPLVYLNNEDKYTLSVGLQLFIGTYKAEWNLMMAAACVVVMPCIIVFLIGQRYFIEGITMSGIKG
jgi:multiple sugar transport system permease protein